jgi:hypothetical protein
MDNVFTNVLSITALSSLGEGWSPLRSEVMSKAGKENNTHLEHFGRGGSRVY